MKEFRVDIKVRNNRLLKLKESTGLTLPEFCKATGVNVTTFYKLVSLQMSPLKKNGAWIPAAVRLSEYANVLPEDLFPEAVLKVDRARARASLEVSPDDVARLVHSSMLELPAPDECVEGAETKECLETAMERLTPRQRQVIELRFGLNGHDEHTYKEVGEKLGVGVDRARMIEAKALCELRRMSKSPNRALAASLGLKPRANGWGWEPR